MRTLIWSFALIALFYKPAYSASSTTAEQNDTLEVENLVQQFLKPEQTTTAPALAKLGKWSVGVRTIELTNGKQLSASDFRSLVNRKLKVEVWYPGSAKAAEANSDKAIYRDQTRSGKPFAIQGIAHRELAFYKEKSSFPLVIISHGYTGYKTIMYYLAEHLASHGYVVASIDHTDSTNADIDFSANSGAGFPSTLYNRARDQQFVLEALNLEESIFSPMIKSDSAAIIGYSMGGYGALNTVGGCYEFSSEFLGGLGFPKDSLSALLPLFNTCSAARKETDKRWQAMISFAPWGGEQNVHQADALGRINIPALFVAGEHDDISGFENGVKKLYQQVRSKNKYLLIYENARHNIAAHPAPKVAFKNDLDIGHYYEPSWNSQTIAQINKHMVLAFLDCHLQQNNSACNFLPQRENAAQLKQADGTLSKAWPGFADRWGLGLRFVRGDGQIKE